MTALEAEAYAERVYMEEIAPFTVSDREAALIKDKLAHAYMDGGLAVVKGIRLPVCQPITATVNQPESEEWKNGNE